jgi:hypothetical protein
MSTAERDSYTVARCPCEKGEIIKNVVSWDNPWSGVDTSFHIKCDKCASEWTINDSGTTLTLRSSTDKERETRNAWLKAKENLDEYLRPLTLRYLARQNPRSKKAEHALLIDAKIYGGSYKNYLEDRKNGLPAQVSYPSRNLTFAEKLVADFGDLNVFASLNREVEERERDYKSGSSKVVRRPVKAETP